MSDTNLSMPPALGGGSSMTPPLVVQQKVFPLQAPYADLTGSQSPAIHLGLTYAPLLDSDTNTNRWFWVSLNGTTVSASGSGDLIANTDKMIGWYLSQTTVRIDVGAGFKYAYVQPTTQVCTGSVTSSISLSAGMFGNVPTAGADFSTSYTQNISDITIDDRSLDSIVQTYTLSASTGGAYKQPSDLMHRGVLSDSLYSVSDIATANLPIITQGVWSAPEGFNGIVPLEIKIEMQLNFVQLVNAVPSLLSFSGIGLLVRATGEKVDSVQLTQVGSFSWDIPFSTVPG